MTTGDRLVLSAALVFAAMAGLAARQPAPTLPSRPLPVTQEEIAADYAGSRACARCHAGEHAQWSKSLHIRMTKPIAEADVAGDFNDVRFSDHGRSYRFQTRNGKRIVSVAHGRRAPEEYEVHYTLGFKRAQGYLSVLPDGRFYVLPAFWSKAQERWLDWKEIAPVPDEAHDLKQIWNVSCFNCHATNLRQGFDVGAQRFNTAWSEMGVGCEACHGPGKPHISLMEEWSRSPWLKPALDRSRSNRQLGPALKIFSPRTADRRQVFDLCAYCHGNKNNDFLGFLPGSRYEDFALPFLVSQPMPEDDPQGDFWPDGRPNRFNRPQALTLSGCFMKGDVTCTSCHVAHGSNQEHSLRVAIADSDTLCTQCHPPLREPAALEAHTRHPASSRGSRCIECHMSDVNWRLLIRRRDHTFAPPVPEMTVRYGVPNGCNGCHDDRTPEWAIAAMDRWYGDAGRRQKAMQVADAFYLAGARDPAALPLLAPLAVDRSRGMLVRASAAEYIGSVYLSGARGGTETGRSGPSQTTLERDTRGGLDAASEDAAYHARADAAQSARRPDLQVGQASSQVGRPDLQNGQASSQGQPIPPELTTRLVNVLIGALADPEPTVRATAARSLGRIGDRRATIPIVARLKDDVRGVRVAAAEALLWMHIAQLPGEAGVLLRKAQDELGQSLSTFPDVVSNHARRAWLETQRGRHAEADTILDLALALDPKYPRSRVLKGIVAARTGRMADAIKHWQEARGLDPAYPNLERMIEEAQKRGAQRK